MEPKSSILPTRALNSPCRFAPNPLRVHSAERDGTSVCLEPNRSAWGTSPGTRGPIPPLTMLVIMSVLSRASDRRIALGGTVRSDLVRCRVEPELSRAPSCLLAGSTPACSTREPLADVQDGGEAVDSGQVHPPRTIWSDFLGHGQHLGVDRAGMIQAHVLTDSSGDDAKTGIKVIKKTKGKLASVTGDAAYDTVAIYDQARSRGARVIVPPTRTASMSGGKPRSKVRDSTIRRVAKVGRKRWKKESGYHRQGRVENAFFRYKSMLGDRLHARGLAAQKTEVAIGCKTLNRQLVLGRPRSVAIAR